MKILAITDKPNSAIDRLARMNEKRLSHMGYTVVSLHPKRPSAQEIAALEEHLKDTDLLDLQYWKSAVALFDRFPDAAKIPHVLTHHNEHNINDDAKNHWAWKNRDWHAHVAKNGWQKAELKKIGYGAQLIPHAVDFENLHFTNELTKDKIVGYVGQVKKVKGVREIAEACKQLGYKLLIVGSVSEADYWKELYEKYEGVIETVIPGTLAVPDNMLHVAYGKMRAYCANSDDGTESGTMPILEAMVSGIPVVTRRIGLVRDCGEHGKNMWIREGAYTDIEDLKKGLQMVVENDDIANDMRENAWRTARQYHPDRQAREYEKLFRKLMYPNERSVSIIMPTAGRNDWISAAIDNLDKQSYHNFELILCDDNGMPDTSHLLSLVRAARNKHKFPIRHVWTHKRYESYGLAKARNLGIIEATGDILVFCDDRLLMHPTAIESFVQTLLADGNGRPDKKWLWGSKGVFKTFVENFSCAWRKSIIDAGMFNERMDAYGGMTQELSGRFAAQGFSFQFCPAALAEPAFGTHSKSRHREDIIKSKVRLYKMGFQ